MKTLYLILIPMTLCSISSIYADEDDNCASELRYYENARISVIEDPDCISCKMAESTFKAELERCKDELRAGPVNPNKKREKACYNFCATKFDPYRQEEDGLKCYLECLK